MPMLPRWAAMRMGLGMFRPVRVDSVWKPQDLSYNKYLASLLTRDT